MSDETPADQNEETPQPKRKGLWAMMNQGQESDQTAEEEPPAEEVSPAEIPVDEPTQPPEEPPKPRGLWGMMQGSALTEETAADEDAEADSDSNATSSPPDEPTPQPKGLWAMMPGTTVEPPAAEETTVREDSADDSEMGSEIEPPEDSAEQTDPDTEPESVSQAEVLGKQSAIPRIESEAVPEPVSRKQPGRKLGRWGLVLGCASVLLAGLAILPGSIPRLPSSIAGFIGFNCGLAAWGEIRRSRKAVRGKTTATAAITLGVLGLVLGQTLFSNLGQNWRREHGRQQTRDRLATLGDAVNEFHDQRGRFPIGGRVENEVPLHGWMTNLLPYLGEDELHAAIDHDLPYSHEDNFEPMTQTVTAFQASGGPKETVQGGMAITHFAGLGGELLDENNGLANVGIFGQNLTVTREDVRDGLSQTLIAGEINSAFPAWGNPENWRTIGKGLNKDRRGFGNADGTGAMFLRADGSVLFVSQKINPAVLRSLSTRDGSENLPPEFRE